MDLSCSANCSRLRRGACPLEHEQMFDLPGERIDRPVQMVVPLRQHERGAFVSNGVQNIVADEAISTLVLGELSVECLELHARVGVRFTPRHERRRADDDRMREGPCSRLNLGADSMPDRAALHEDDRVMTVLPSDGGGEAKHIPGPGPSCNLFEAVRRQMMALVHDELAILGHAVVHPPSRAGALAARSGEAWPELADWTGERRPATPLRTRLWMSATSINPVGLRLPPPIRPIRIRGIPRNVDRRSTHWSSSCCRWTRTSVLTRRLASSHAAIDLIDAGRLDDAEHAAHALVTRYPEVHSGGD